jgi:hypothetical protein
MAMAIAATLAPASSKLSMGIAMTRTAGNKGPIFRWGDVTTSPDPEERGAANVSRPVLEQREAERSVYRL